jgi:hypothetical protein
VLSSNDHSVLETAHDSISDDYDDDHGNGAIAIGNEKKKKNDDGGLESVTTVGAIDNIYISC